MDDIIPIGTKVSFLQYGRGPHRVGHFKFQRFLGIVVDYTTNEDNILYIVRVKIQNLRRRDFTLRNYIVHPDNIEVEGLPIIPEANENIINGGGTRRKRGIQHPKPLYGRIKASKLFINKRGTRRH